jgi:hypothetical protein
LTMPQAMVVFTGQHVRTLPYEEQNGTCCISILFKSYEENQLRLLF